jgi:hypothetical protein
MPAIHADVAHIHAATLGPGQLERGHLKPGGEAKFMGPQVRGASRKNTDRHVRARQAIHDFADRPISGAGDDNVIALLARRAGQFRGLAAARFLPRHDVPPLGPQVRQNNRQVKLPPARAWIGDQTCSQ